MSSTSSVILVARLARKELREILRDRRTILTLILMPVLLYPILAIAFQQYLVMSQPPKGETPKYVVAFPTFAEGERFDQVCELAKIPGDPEWDKRETPDVSATVREGKADLGVTIENADRRINPFDFTQSFACKIIVREDSAIGLKAAELLKERFTDANILILRQRLRAKGVRDPSLPIPVTTEVIAAVEGKKSSPLASVVPLILVLMTITGAVYPAIDLTAGERERGTLEVLMAAPIPRIGVLLAKYVAVLAVAMLTGLVNLTMMMITVYTSGLKHLVFEAGFNFSIVASMFGLLLLFSMFFSAVLLAVTSFARSFKEAQAYLIPLMLLALAPGMLSLMDVQLTGFLKVAPLVNVVLLAREILRGGVSFGDTVIVVGSTLGYAAAAIGVASRIFGAEAVLYSEQGQMSDLFRRPRSARPEASVTAALFCLAIVFPMTVLLGGALSQVEVGPESRLLLGMAATAALFVGVPFFAAWHGRVDLIDGFRFRRASIIAFMGAALLGLSLWPLVAQIFVWEEAIGLTSMPQLLADKLHELAAERQTTSPALVLLALALAPAVVEEIFFRGWLFTALERAMRPWHVILLTAILFGFFHLFTGGILLLERLLPTALLGIVLGVLRWRSGSILPGIVLHALHNGLLQAIALYPATFGPLSLAVNGLGNVPPLWLFGAIGVSLCGGGLVWWSGRK